MSVRNINENRQLGTINLLPLDDSENHWELIMEDVDCLPFFREVWPYLTMGDLCKMRKSQAMQVKWSAYGYGVIVKINGDTRW